MRAKPIIVIVLLGAGVAGALGGGEPPVGNRELLKRLAGADPSTAEERSARHLARLEALRSETLAATPSPPTVSAPDSYVLSIDGGFGLGGFVFKDGAPLLHDQGTFNVAFGSYALSSGTTGASNTAIGDYALRLNTSGYGNTASGALALLSNGSGSQNTASGSLTLLFNTTGSGNTASGAYALLDNTEGYGNTANGWNALTSNTTGVFNAACGTYALHDNTTGSHNTAAGAAALYYNTTGDANIAIGIVALIGNTSGAYNIGIGYSALANNNGSFNIAIGSGAGGASTGGTSNIFIGSGGLADDDGVIRIGDSFNSSTFIEGIFGATSAGGSQVFINSNNQLGTATSSRRFKEEIEDMAEASSALLDLRPVTFRYTEEAVGDGPRPIDFGLIAEEVAEVYPDLVVYDENGEPYSVRYHVLAAMLLNELQRQERRIALLEARSRQLEVVRESHAALVDRLERLEAAAGVDPQCLADRPSPERPASLGKPPAEGSTSCASK